MNLKVDLVAPLSYINHYVICSRSQGRTWQNLEENSGHPGLGSQLVSINSDVTQNESDTTNKFLSV